MSILNRLPEKRSKQWLMLIIPMACVICGLIALLSKVELSLSISSTDVGIWMFISVIAAVLICGFGYAGLKIAFQMTVIGVVAGIIFMAYVFAQPIETKGIVGLVSGVELTAIIAIVGVNLQMIHHIRRRRGI